MNIIVLFEHLEEFINQLNVVNIQKDQFKIFIHFLLAFPAGLVLRRIHNPIIRKSYTASVGLFFMMYLGASWMWLVQLTAMSIFALSYLKKPFIPITLVSFAVLGYFHYDRFVNQDSNWKMGFNVVQMMLTCRLVYFGAAAEDKSIQYSFLDYYSYVFYFPNIIVGTVPFTGYVDFMNLSGHFSAIPTDIKPALLTLAKAVAFTVADQVLRPKFDFNWFTSEEWIAGSLLYRQLIIQMIAFCARFKYFLAFNYAQAAMDAGGITYDGSNFTNYRLANYRFELEFNPIKRTKHWNSSVQVWLQQCIYERYKHSKLALPATFVLSAFWHGFFFIYYFFFMEWALFNEISKQVYRAKDKFRMIPKYIRYMICLLFGQIVVNSTAVPVALLQWDRAWKVMNDLGWVAQLMMVSVFVVMSLTKVGKSKQI